MIRKLNENDRKITINFLSKQAAINLFIIGDIENFGFDSEFQEVWGSFNKENNLNGVLLRFYENFIPYYEDENIDIDGFKKIIFSNKNAKIISGEKSIVDNFYDVFENSKEKNSYFCEMVSSKKLLSWSNSVKIASKNEAQGVYDLIDTIKEFKDSLNPTVKQLVRKIEDKSGRIYYIENENKEIVSVAQTAAENSKSAMVVGVATREDYRNKGLLSKCLSRLCNDLLNENKTLCLFYDNPKAGRIYHRLGFETIGKWTMLIKE
ncbi:GNAT family N-acetyltransferase [Clostridium sp. CCUG 7971]|uniref:GNAT family N-acetyltransferase n=1 Tax=Clostridium sp. CCUG 7971 TaxID=2811414 RepID=UPI001ABABF7E|nr:GNAT family N-acetyltransferase [Clostridium sp. CCUG 7971]MBO3444755.1 GNAT family N-acetyltransferase [Clostridium sp. CCUG 7971]